jgi:ABC-type multidrug transport system fused ATPase/permease subunit
MSLINITELLAIMRRLGLPLRVFAFLLFLNVLSIFFEVAGVGMLLPVFEMLRASGSVAINQREGWHWEIMRSISAHVGIPITLSLLLGLSFSFIVLRTIFMYLTTRYTVGLRNRLTNKIRQRVFYRFLLADTAMQDQSSVGEVMAMLQVDLNRALDVLFSMTQSIGTVIQLLSYVGALFLLSPLMSLLSVGGIVLTAFLTRGFFVEIKQRGTAMTKANRRLWAFMVERLKHARLIRLSGTEKPETAAFYQLSCRLSEETLRQRLTATRMGLLVDPVAAGVAYLMLFIGAQTLGLSLERLGLFTVVLIRLVPILRGLLSQSGAIVGMLPSLERVDQYLTETLLAREPSGGDRSFARVDRDIHYEHVSFRYANRNVSALNDITVTIPAHRMSALVGPSGAGKSTFVDLLPRLRDAAAGEIWIDGIPITEFSVVSLRAGIAFVPQQPQIFNISAAEHIRYGKKDATDDEVREAARLAGAIPFIEALPNGFDTLLGDGGLLLSGGQRQRLDIARALVRRAPILILDEPTSNLDADAEADFRAALRTLRTETDLTIMVIAHRMSTIADADQIVVLRQGRVEAVGSHDELMLAGHWYANAFRKQQGPVAKTQSAAVEIAAES